MQVEKVETSLFKSMASSIIQKKAFQIYGKALPKCKLMIGKVIKTKSPQFCIYDDLNPATVNGSKFWANLFLEENSFNNSLQSEQYERLKKVAANTSSPIENVFETYVEDSPFASWIREVIS